MLFKRTLAAILCSAMVLLAAGCNTGPTTPTASQEPASTPAEASGSEAPSETAGPDAGVPADTASLQMVFYGEKSNRMREFSENELREKLLEDLNIELTVTYVPWSEYGTGKIDMMLASGEDFATYTDVGYTGRCYTKKTVADLTEAAEKYLPDLRRVVQPEAFECYTFDGRLYSIPIGNKPNAGEGYGIAVRQDLLEEVGMTEITSLEELETFYDLCKELHPDYVGFCSPTNIGQILSYVISDKNIEFVDARVSEKGMIFTDADASDDLLYSWYESEEFKKNAEIARRWYEKGIIPQYAMTNPSQLDADWNAGKTMMKFGNAQMALGATGSQLKNTVPEAEIKVYYLGNDRPKINTQLWNTAYLVSAGAKDVDRYAMLINYMQKDQETIDFLMYGVEGVDYVMEDGVVERLTTDVLFDDWMLDNKEFMRFVKGITPEAIEEYKNWDNGAIMGKSVGFMFDEEPVRIQKAQLDAIVEELGKPILWGFVDYDENIDNLISRIKDAGFDEYMEEMQRQFTEFRAGK